MRAVTVTRLREHLANLLRLVRRGQTLDIYQHDRLVACIVPPAKATRRPPRRARLRRVAGVRYGPMRGVPLLWKQRPPGPRPTGALDALIEERRTGR